MTDAQMTQRIAELTSTYAQDPKFPTVINNKNLYAFFLDKEMGWLWRGEPAPTPEESKRLKVLVYFYSDKDDDTPRVEKLEAKAKKARAKLTAKNLARHTSIASLFL